MELAVCAVMFLEKSVDSEHSLSCLFNLCCSCIFKNDCGGGFRL